ncbi:SMP-30/gluconolactonase/LRE family protein [Polynucleobacter sp. Latsch14-2]|jgi:sugar lactone lactonase YvrE|uniref:SMP-30/gluconolactonase/LRE family protein n=1 Tax=Polynucleobacter sp. Latsch14-2 TaxID=2576920 RepID=UPI001C0BA83D|nr:SMP-30/gluconolactonase/LRE family protein [Polynucleobacter sp. Latsch14-2]MBU3614223.1 SMP-30/gluconolactonase/LRE family protein [Polynucleobacter sp. Latsch14-2]
MTWNFECVAGPFNSELGGILWDEGGLIFSLINELQLQKLNPANGSISAFRSYTGRMNGLAKAKDGSIFACQDGGRRVIQLQPDGSANVTATRFEGQIHNHPYDLCVDSKGRVWFSDPHSATPAFGPQIFPPLPYASIMRLERDRIGHWIIKRLSFDTTAPKAILLSDDEKTLFVAENPDDEHRNRELRAYPIDEDGNLGEFAVLHSFGRDHKGLHAGIHGMCKDSAGQIYACAGDTKSARQASIYQYSSAGQLLRAIPFPHGTPIRCCFAGEEDKHLYITSSDKCIYRLTLG